MCTLLLLRELDTTHPWTCTPLLNRAFHGTHNRNRWPKPSIDAYNAVIWRLYLDDRPDDIHKVLAAASSQGLSPNDRTLHAVQRMGERIAQRKRKERDGWYVHTYTPTPTPTHTLISLSFSLSLFSLSLSLSLTHTHTHTHKFAHKFADDHISL